jgi:hypothetical protein
MFTGLVVLILGGFVGVERMLQYQGVSLGVIDALSPLFRIHWFLMIYGFLLSLISLEILALLSFEWSGRVAGSIYRLIYLFLLWLSFLLLIAGYLDLSLLITSSILILVTIYAFRTFLTPSRLGFKPTYYNFLLTASPGIGAAIILPWVFTRHATGSVLYEISLASLAFPTASIIAVESRDIPLLLGGSAGRSSAGRSSVTGYVLLVSGIFLFSLNTSLSIRSIGGLLAIAGAVSALLGSGLLRSLLHGVGRGIVPRHMANYSAIHLVTAFSWLIAGGALMFASPLALESTANLRDLLIHAISLGFIFNIIFGVDAVLMYSHMGISLRKAPKPSYIPYVLLNLSLILRAVYDITGYIGITTLSTPLTGLSVIFFFALHNIRIMKLRKELAQVAN